MDRTALDARIKAAIAAAGRPLTIGDMKAAGRKLFIRCRSRMGSCGHIGIGDPSRLHPRWDSIPIKEAKFKCKKCGCAIVSPTPLDTASPAMLEEFEQQQLSEPAPSSQSSPPPDP